LTLTAKQFALLEFVTEFITLHGGMAPTVHECALHFGKSDSTMQAHLTILARKGYLHRTTQARSITLRDPRFFNVLRYLPLLKKLDESRDLAEQDVSDYMLCVLPRTRKNCFAFLVPDDSLHDVGIFEGDLGIAEWCAVPEAGELVVTGTPNGIRITHFFGRDPFQRVFGVVLSIRRSYREMIFPAKDLKNSR